MPLSNIEATMLLRSAALALLIVASVAPAAYAQQQQPMQGMWGSTGQYRGSTNRGQIYSPDGRYIGQVQRPSTAPSSGGEGGFGRTTPNAARQADRQSDVNRPVYGANGQYLGTVNRQGQFYDAQGAYRGLMR
jgi:hypothetical protein